MAKVKAIGDRVDAVFHTYVDDQKRCRDVWHPRVEADGKMFVVSDSSTETKCAECGSRKEALRVAKSFRDRMKVEWA